MRALIGVVGVLASACGGDPPAMPTLTADTALVVRPGTVALYVGEQAQLGAHLHAAGETLAVQVAWLTRDPDIATVDSLGLVSGRGPGTTVAVASSGPFRDSAIVAVATAPLPLPALALVAQSPDGPWVHATAPASDSARLYVVAQRGFVRVLRNDTLLATPFLDLRDRVLSGGERGLFSIAFHPAYPESAYVYASFTGAGGQSRIERFAVVDPETANRASALRILTLDQPFANHNGGQLAFGLDGFLYVGFGDGGGAGDPLDAGQDLGTWLGTILRIDVNGGPPYAVPPSNPFVGDPNALPEIWAWGLRNPWRFSFDRMTGDLYIADVGQGAWEEINVQPAASAGGANYGWSVMEGRHCFGVASCDQAGLALPAHEYAHDPACSVTGGYVYRGTAVEALAGRYLFADYCAGWVRSLVWTGSAATQVREWPTLAPPGGAITSFGEDARGELYVAAGTSLYRIVPQP